MLELAAHEPYLGVCPVLYGTGNTRPSLSGKVNVLGVIYGRTTPQKP